MDEKLKQINSSLYNYDGPENRNISFVVILKILETQQNDSHNDQESQRAGCSPYYYNQNS